MSTTTFPDPEGKGLSEPERFIDAYVAPGKTFLDIRRNANWWFPFVVSIVLGLLFSFSVQKKIGFESVVRQQISQSKMAQTQIDQLPADKQAAAVQSRVGITERITYFYWLVGLIVAAIVAGVFMLSCNFILGAQEPYKRYFAVWMYGSLPFTIKFLLATVLIFAGASTAENFDMQNPVGSNIGYYLGPGSAAWLKTLLTSADIFTIWTVILLSLGLSITAKVSRGGAAAVVVGWWMLIVLIGTAFAAMTA